MTGNSPSRAARAYAETLLMVAVSTGAGLLLAPRWGTSAVDLLYLLPVLAAASIYGLWPALFGGAVSALAYNFFFTAPLHTFRIHSPSDIVTVLVLFVVAVVTSQLAARMRTQARVAAAAASRNATIAGFAGRLLSASTREDVGRISCAELAGLFRCRAVMRVRIGDDTETLAGDGSESLTPGDVAASAWVLENGQSAGRGAPRLNPAEWLFFPIKAGDRTLAALGLAREDGRPPVPEEQLPLLTSLLDQSALALERAALEIEMRGLDALRARDRLRGALLSSVGHDLRTPLTAIAAAGAELRRRAGDDDDPLVETIETEASKLDRYIANLLDMARIEAGAVRLRSEPLDIVDAVSNARRDLKRILADHIVSVDLPSDLPLVRADPQLLHHCLINLLDNAVRHGGGGTSIRISADREADGVRLAVEDEGPGLPGGGDLFATFRRIAGSDRKGGTGLGLAIVEGFADAMGLDLDAGNRKDAAGARFSLLFPVRLLVGETVSSE